MKHLIVNGDDFGASRGINRGIIEAHQRGILTSASLLVKAPGSEEAAELSRAVPALSVGLHVDIGAGSPRAGAALRRQLSQQLQRFVQLMGRKPTHLDSHHNVHREPAALAAFFALAQQHELPLREHSPVLYFPKFYGQWGGVTHWEHISATNLAHLLRREIGEGITELSCHPGYVEPGFRSGYTAEREAEVRALCAPLVRRTLREQNIHLVSYHALGNVLAETAL